MSASDEDDPPGSVPGPSEDAAADGEEPQVSERSHPEKQSRAEDFEESQDEPEWAGDRGHDSDIVSDAVKGRTVFHNSTLHIGGDFNAGGGTDRGVMLPIADVTGAVEDHEARFVEPGSFERLIECVQSERVVLLIGVGCGKRTAAEAALLRTGHTPVLQLPADVPARGLVDGIKRACAKEPRAGVVIESVDPEMLAALAGFELRRLKSALPAGACVVLTTGSRRAELPSTGIGAPIVECAAPDLGEVIARASAGGVREEVVSLALGAMALLDGQVGSPETALALLDVAAREASLSPAEVAGVFAGTATAETLNGWLATGQSAEHVASLTAGAALEGAVIGEVDDAAARLAKLLAGETEEDASAPKTPKAFKVANRGWPADVLTVTRRPLSTHFGRHETEVVEVRSPHTREQIISHLWESLGSDYRGPFARWLRELPAAGGEQLGFGAAVTAGIIFARDPITAETELLRRWALDDELYLHACAGLALGVPVAIGADPAAARALVRAWGSSDNLCLRHVAVLAYGGLLGAWDPGSAAPSHLWRIAAETPALRRSADISLAALTAAGASASRARATVLGVLCAQAALRRPPVRAFELLPLIVEHLTARETVARESLTALLGEQERDSLTALTGLLAQALLMAQGYESGCAVLQRLLEAMAESRVDEETVCLLIDMAIEAVPEPERASSLRAQLRRPLLAHARGRGPVAEAAQTVLAEVPATV